ncbi:GNAT family N-acetyltransferase [Paenibacillus sp. N3.4]|uniref:GNAT family N-acetyltransferase n=1 Tax=Paenibacillus sp. N3.4 TaxID=2603222 RepID=UPI0011CA2C77|nr:GNAT family N-acetyltransferase [Paenibacillus sp. N3.4]TXK80673.1 GNAT family N-acetyltransferase [Paenibacillus sp. N3.4]
MTFTVRFGRMNDLEDIASEDQSVLKNILNWKLQNQEILLAEENNEIIGYLRIEYLWSKYPYIGLIIVRPEYRKQGIGKTLLEYLEDHLRKQGIKTLYSSSQVNEAEPQKWHRHMGFKECGIINGINPGDIGEVFFLKSI